MFAAYESQIESSSNPQEARRKIETCIKNGRLPYVDTDPNEVESMAVPEPVKKLLLMPSLNHILPEARKLYLDVSAALSVFSKEYPEYLLDIPVLKTLILSNIDEIIYENNQDYRYKVNGKPISNRYFSSGNHNKFFNYDTWFSEKSACDRHKGDIFNELRSPLAIAVYSKSINVLRGYVSYLMNHNKKIPMSKKDVFSISPLKYAVTYGHQEMVKYLIKIVPFIGNGCLDLDEALSLAAFYGDQDMVGILLDGGANANTVDPEKYLFENCLLNSIINKKPHIGTYLIRRNAINLCSIYNDSNNTIGSIALPYALSSYFGLRNEYNENKEKRTQFKILIETLINKGVK